MDASVLTPTITAVAGAAVATTVALVNGAIASRAKESEELRSLRLQTYPSVWGLTSEVPRWPRGDPAYRDLWTLHRSLRTWYFSTGGLYLSENARARYGEMQELLDAVLCGRPEDDTTPVRELAPVAEPHKPETVYEALMNTCSAFRTALTEDLATRRTRSIVWATALWLRHRRQRRAARRRIAAARGRLSKRDPATRAGIAP